MEILDVTPTKENLLKYLPMHLKEIANTIDFENLPDWNKLFVLIGAEALHREDSLLKRVEEVLTAHNNLIDYLNNKTNFNADKKYEEALQKQKEQQKMYNKFILIKND